MARYVSPLREAQAAHTRRRILDAAIAEFGENGYSGTALGAVARRAGVSLETVKQMGPKGALLLAAFDHAFSQSEGDGPLHTREFGAAAASLEGDALLAFQLDFVAGANARVARLWPRLLDAVGDPEVARRLAELQENRRADMHRTIARYRATGLCTSARSDEELATALSFLISPESYAQLVLDSGWSPDFYRSWLDLAIRRMILTD